MVTLLIEETMRLAFIQVQITANSQSLHATLKLLGSDHRYQPILRTHADNGGRHALMNPMHGGKSLPVALHSLMAVTLGSVIVDRVEEHQCVG